MNRHARIGGGLLKSAASAGSLGLAAMLAFLHAKNASSADIPPAVRTDNRWRDDTDDVTLYISGIGQRMTSSAAPFAVAGLTGLFGGYQVLRRRRP